MSKPEPSPKNKGVAITPLLINWINKQEKILDHEKSKAVELIKQRSEFGISKYGQPLMSEDGRDELEDAKQELGDLIQYTYKAKMKGRSTKEIEEIVSVLMTLLSTDTIIQ